MPTLTDAADISYNGYSFPLYSRSSLLGRPAYDASKRAVMYVEYTLEVRFTVTATPNLAGSTDTEAALELIRQRLTARGGALEMNATGFGHVRVNGGGLEPGVDFRDLAYGPHPQILQAKPLVSRMAWELTWQCVFRIPECSEGTAVTVGRPLEFVYTWDVTQGDDGFSTRTLNGSLTIPATTVPGEKVPPDVADRYWDTVVASIPPIPGFKRNLHRSLSEDRRTVKFTITDTELPVNGFVPGMTDWSAEQEVSSNQALGFTRWDGSLSATYKLSRERSKADAFAHFMNLAASRARVNPGLKEGQPIPMAFRAHDSITSQEVSFTFHWAFVTIGEIATALAASGMWTPIPGTGWAPWAQSMAQSALAARGNAKLFYNPASDTIIDLCAASTTSISGGGSLGGPRVLNGRLPRGKNILSATLPSPEQSWLHAESFVVWDSDQGVAVLRPLPPTTQPNQTRTLKTGGIVLKSGIVGAPRGAKLQNQMETSIPFAPSPTRGHNTIQHRALPDTRVRLVGQALRYGYPIDMPALLGAAGVAAVLKRPQFAQGTIAGVGGVPLFYASWNLEYVLTAQKDATLPIPPNPMLDD